MSFTELKDSHSSFILSEQEMDLIEKMVFGNIEKVNLFETVKITNLQYK